MINRPLVSIIMPTLNQGEYILEALNSIWSQDYDHLEILVVDGKSNDGTVEILNKYTDRISFWASEKDSGTSEAINKGFEWANGKYCWILNSDDKLYDSTSISNLVNVLERNNSVAFVFGNMQLINKDGEKIGVINFRNLDLSSLYTDRRYLPFPGCLLRKSILKNLGYFDLGLKFSNDLDFYLRLFSQFQVASFDGVTGVYRIHVGASTQANVFESGRESIEICRKRLKNENCFSKKKKESILNNITMFEIALRFHTGKAEEVRQLCYDLLKKDSKYLVNPKFSLYFFFSLFGSKSMTNFSRIVKAASHMKFFFAVNNFISRPRNTGG